MAPLKTGLLLNSSFPAIKPLPGKKKNFPDVTARVNSQPMIFWKLGNSSGVEVGMNQNFPSVKKIQLPTPPVNSSFPAVKPLPSTKKSFLGVTARVNSQPMIFWKLGNSSGVEVGMNRMFPSVGKTQLPKPRTLHDSSAVSDRLKTADEDKFIQRKVTQPTEELNNPKGQYLRTLLLKKSEKLRTPYSVPSSPVVDEAIQRKPTRPMKVLTAGAVRLDRRVEFVPRRVLPAIPKVESLAPDEDFPVKKSGSRSQMNVVLETPKKELFLINQLIADTKNSRMIARTTSGVQQKRPRETSSQETAEAIPGKKPRATTKKAISHSARNEVLPAAASKLADDPLPNTPSPIKLTFRLKPKLSPSDSSVEYTVAINSS